MAAAPEKKSISCQILSFPVISFHMPGGGRGRRAICLEIFMEHTVYNTSYKRYPQAYIVSQGDCKETPRGIIPSSLTAKAIAELAEGCRLKLPTVRQAHHEGGEMDLAIVLSVSR